MKTKPMMMTNPPLLVKGVLVRDLMKAIYIFGFAGREIPCVTTLVEAHAKLRAGQAFYAYGGGNTVYEVSPKFYRSLGLARRAIRERLDVVFMPPEAPGL